MKTARLLPGVAIAVAALYFTFRDIDFAAFAGALRNAAWGWFIPAGALFLFVLLVRAARWAALMGGAPLGLAFHALNIGYMMNMLLPGRLGEIGRAYVIGERSSISMPRAISAVVVERMLDLAAVVLMLAVAARYVPLPPELARPAAISSALVLALLIVISVMIWQSARVAALLRRLLAPLSAATTERWVGRFLALCAGFETLGSPARVLRVLALTLLIWLVNIALAALTMRAFVPMSLPAAALVVVVANLGGAIPTPGGIGPAQYFARLALTPFDIDASGGVAFVFVWWFAQLLALVALGFIGLLSVGLSFQQLRNKDA